MMSNTIFLKFNLPNKQSFSISTARKFFYYSNPHLTHKKAHFLC